MLETDGILEVNASLGHTTILRLAVSPLTDMVPEVLGIILQPQVGV
jgi:hypothetical protein